MQKENKERNSFKKKFEVMYISHVSILLFGYKCINH